MFCGCTEDASNGGKSEPMSFSSEICNHTQTRAVVDTSKHSGTNLIVRAAELAKGITLNVSKMTRTSTPDGYWPNGASIAVQQGGTTKQYIVDNSGNITSSSPFYWMNKNNVSVTSWFPYSESLPTIWSVNSNQSTESNYNGSDLLYSSGILSYDGSKTLQYNHQTAKVVINIVKANGLMTSSNISSITIGTSITPIILSGTVSSNGSITTATKTGYITPYQTASSTYAATYSALVIPQDMKDKQFIAIKAANGVTYYYKPTTSTVLSAGYEYDYNITAPYVNIGDYYYSDGTWGTNASPSGKTVIGIIFSNSTSTNDKAHGWTHGYAMALTNAIYGNNIPWASSSSGFDTTTEFGPNNFINTIALMESDIDGYTHSLIIKNKAGSNLQSYYTAFYYALNYGTANIGGTKYAAPQGTSGWYLPSMGQLYLIIRNLGKETNAVDLDGGTYGLWYNEANNVASNINAYLSNVNGDLIIYSSKNNNWYWSSSEANNTVASDVNFTYDGNLHLDNFAYKTDSDPNCTIRSVLAF
jgi:hypothetical protein